MTLPICAADPTRCAHGFHPDQRPFHTCPELEKLAGIQATNDAASDDTKASIDAAIKRWAAKGVEFSANSCRDEFPGVTGAVIGGRFSVAAKAGLIVDTGKRVPSTLPSTHGAEVRVWRGAQAAKWHVGGAR